MTTLSGKPLAFDLDIGLVHPPRASRFPFVFLCGQSDQRGILDYPTVQRGMVYFNAAFLHDLFDISIGNAISDIEKKSLLFYDILNADVRI